MAPLEYYRDVENRFCQGDIFLIAPNLFLKERLQKPRTVTLAGQKHGFEIDELSHSSDDGTKVGLDRLQTGNDVLVPVSTLIGPAILLSHGCEIDKDKKHRIIALIRSMGNLKEEEKNHIRSHGRRACFHLPQCGNDLPEGYVDFRRISTVTLEWLESKKRVKSLTEDARRQLLVGLFLFFSRIELSVESLPWTEEQEDEPPRL
jgi:hypothetical protein